MRQPLGDAHLRGVHTAADCAAFNDAGAFNCVNLPVTEPGGPDTVQILRAKLATT